MDPVADINHKFLEELKFVVAAVNQTLAIIEERLSAIERRLQMGPYLNALEIYDPATHIEHGYYREKNELSGTESMQMSPGKGAGSGS